MHRYYYCWLGLALLALLAGQCYATSFARVSSAASLLAALQNQDVQHIWLERGISLEDGLAESVTVVERNVTVEPAPELKLVNATVPLAWSALREPRLLLRPGVTLLLRFLELRNVLASSGLPYVFGIVARSPGARLQLEGCLSPQQVGLGVPAMLQITRSLPRAGGGSVGGSAATPAAVPAQQATYAVPPGALCYSQGQLAAATELAATGSDRSVEVWRVCVPYEAQVLADVSFEEPTTGIDGDTASVLLGTASGAGLLGGYTVQMTQHMTWVEHPVSEECTRTRPMAVCIHELLDQLASGSDGSSQSQSSLVIALAVVAPCAAVALAVAAVFACLYMRQRRARKAAAVSALAAIEGTAHAGRGDSGSTRSTVNAADGRSSGKAAEGGRDDVESGLGGDTASSSGSDRPGAAAKGDGNSNDVLFNGFEDANGDSAATWRPAPAVRALDRCSAASATTEAQAPCAAAEQLPVCASCGGLLTLAAACGPGAVTPAAVGPASRPTIVAVHAEIEPAATNGVSDCGITTCRCSTATESMASRTGSAQHHSLLHQVLLLGRHSAAGGAPPSVRPSSSSTAAGVALGKAGRSTLPGGAVVVTLRPDQPRLAAALQALQQAHSATAAAEPVAPGAMANVAAAVDSEAAPAHATENSISFMAMVRSMSSGGQPHSQTATGAGSTERCLQEDVAPELGAASSVQGMWQQKQLAGQRRCQQDKQLQVPSLEDAGTSTGALAPAFAGANVLDASSASRGQEISIMRTQNSMGAINERAQHKSTDAVTSATALSQDANAKNMMSSMRMQPTNQAEYSVTSNARKVSQSANATAEAGGARSCANASEAVPLQAAGRVASSSQAAHAACAASSVPGAPSAGVGAMSISSAATQPALAAAAAGAVVAAAPHEAAAPAQRQAAGDLAGPLAAAGGAAHQQQADAPAPGASAPGTPAPGSRQAAQLEAAAETDVADDAPAAGDAAGAGAVPRSASKMDLVLAELEEMKRSHAMEVKDVQLRLVELLGEGAFGVVYKGQWQGLDVAVKTVIFNSLGTTRKAALAEAALSSAVCHSNVVATYLVDVQPLFTPEAAAAAAAAAVDDGPAGASGSVALDYRLYIVQEFCDAGPLRQLILSGRLHDPLPVDDMAATAGSAAGPSAGADGAAGSSASAATAVAAAQRTVESVHGAVRLAPVYEIALGISRALAHLHAKGIVHSDLSAANVLLKRDPSAVSGLSAKIADFGLSVMIPKHLTHLSGRRCGSPFYIAPEVYQRGHASPAADIFAFGVLLWELVMGTSAGVVDENSGQFQYSKLFPLLPGPRTCPPALRQLVHTCLQRLPAKRPSAAQVALLLERLLAAVIKQPDAGAAGPAARAAAAPAVEAGAAAAPAAVPPAFVAKGSSVTGGSGLTAAPPAGAVAV